MDEILYELREHAAGLNAGRWDYIFSVIKKFRERARVRPARPRAGDDDRAVHARVHRAAREDAAIARGAHAIGGMAAFIPSRRDAEVNERALAKVREDKEREAGDGFDGTWVAHPDLVPVAREEFDACSATGPTSSTGSARTSRSTADGAARRARPPAASHRGRAAQRTSASALHYLDAWLGGAGAAAIYNLMEDAATAEISRSQLWQWVRHGARLDDGTTVTARRARGEEIAARANRRAPRPRAPPSSSSGSRSRTTSRSS